MSLLVIRIETAFQTVNAALSLATLGQTTHNVDYATFAFLTAARERAVGAVAVPFGEPLLTEGRGIILAHCSHYAKVLGRTMQKLCDS